MTDVLSGKELVVAAEVTLYDPATESEETRYYSTHGYTVVPSDSVAPGRYYAARLHWPRITWSRWSGTSIGQSSADRVTLELAAGDTEADITAQGLVVDGRSILLRLGAKGLDLSEWLPWHLTGQSVYRSGSGERLVIEAASPDVIFDQALSRDRYLGLGGCLYFDGSTTAEIAHHGSLVATTALCIEALVELDSTGQAQVVVSKGTTAPTADGEASLWVAADDRPRFWVWNTAGTLTGVIGTTALQAGQIYRLTGRWDGSQIEIYVDGQLEAAQAFAGPLRSGTEPVAIGDDGTGSRHLRGKVDDVRWWVDSFVPISERIAEWALQELPEEEHRKPAAYLRCNEPGGDTAFDDSLHGRNATLEPGLLEVEDMWSTLYEGEPGQRDLSKPVAIGDVRRVPGVRIAPLVWQVHGGPVRGIGPVDEGALYLAQRMTRSASDIWITIASGISASVPEDSISTSGAVDFGGLIPGQYIRVTTTTQTAVVQVLALSTSEEIRVKSGSLSAEAAGGSITVQTTGWKATASDIAFTDRTITSASSGFPALPSGTEITVSGAGANNGTHTLVESSTSGLLTFAGGTFTPAPAGPSITLVAEELWDYESDLSRGLITLRRAPTLPLAIAFRGPAAAGSTRSGILQWIASLAGVGSYDAKSWGDLEAADSAPVGRWLGQDDEEITYRQLLDHFAVGDSVGFAPATGQLEVALRVEPITSELQLDYRTQLFRLEAQDAAAAIGGQACPWGRSRVVLAEDQVAGLAHQRYPDNVAFAREELRRERAVEAPAVKRKHPQAEDGPEIDSPFTAAAGALAAAQRTYALESVDRQVWLAEGPFLPLLIDLRQGAITLRSDDHPGLEAGRRFVVLRIEIDTERVRAIFYLWG